ncbi:hypothetical protein F4860DRAFT_322742 [Xylaria cubensis]|nr:hypothetical protein F4860DRAFT_322742 [Xylaria cubensis]
MNLQSSSNEESPLRLNQLKAKPCVACLALGLSCTSTDPGETPCQSCLYAGSSGILRSRLCMRATPFEDISIFLYCLPKAEVPRNDLDLDEISLDFNVTWTLPSIMSDVAEFLRPARQVSTKPTSKVGMLCSLNFVELIHKHIPHKAAWLFRSMLYGMSFSYAHPNHAMHTGGLSAPALQLLGAQAGHQILRYLDNELSPQRLLTFSIEKRQVLFLLVFGAILAIRYARKTDLSQELPTTSPMSEELWEMMRGHLCEMLAHHLVLLGASVGVPLSKDEEERVLRLPAITWNRQGTHVWEVDEKHSSYNSGDLKPCRRVHGSGLLPNESSRLRAAEKDKGCNNYGYKCGSLGGGPDSNTGEAVWQRDCRPTTTQDPKKRQSSHRTATIESYSGSVRYSRPEEKEIWRYSSSSVPSYLLHHHAFRSNPLVASVQLCTEPTRRESAQCGTSSAWERGLNKAPRGRRTGYRTVDGISISR